METIAPVREFIVERFLFGDNGALTDDASFLDNGLIDSMGIMELVAFLEKTFEIKIEDGELIPRNLDSLNRIRAFLESKRKPPTG
jgi:acyl carrier protein